MGGVIPTRYCGNSPNHPIISAPITARRIRATGREGTTRTQLHVSEYGGPVRQLPCRGCAGEPLPQRRPLCSRSDGPGVYSTGYFDGSRAVAAILAWSLVFGLALVGPLPFPATASGRVAVVGMAGLAVWSAVSLAWAPLAGPVVDGVQRDLLYLGVLLAAVGVLRSPRASRAAEPLLALGAGVVIAYGLAGRLVPE